MAKTDFDNFDNFYPTPITDVKKIAVGFSFKRILIVTVYSGPTSHVL